MVTFNEVKKEFKEHNCKLLMTEDEFNLKPRNTHEKYPYIASCTHNNEVWFDCFKNTQSGIKCPKCVRINDSINKIEKYKLNPVSSMDLEFGSIENLKTIIGDSFDVKFNGEGCLADCSIKPKHITENKWLMVQIKSTGKPTINGYGFQSSSKYINCIIMCICVSDKKMWLFDGNKMITKSISIGLKKKSKYDEFEITKDTIHEKMTYYYNTFPKYDFETTDTPINPSHQLEREYRIIRETMIPCVDFLRNERQGLVYDFMINGLKFQEKVKSKVKNRNDITFNLNKNKGIINGVKQSISYQKGDNDFYWLNVNNKQHFYVIPEDELIRRNIINIDKTSGITLNPISKIGNNIWANEYLFDYTKIDEEKLKIMFNL